jgi:hypothetical protein
MARVVPYEELRRGVTTDLIRSHPQRRSPVIQDRDVTAVRTGPTPDSSRSRRPWSRISDEQIVDVQKFEGPVPAEPSCRAERVADGYIVRTARA